MTFKIRVDRKSVDSMTRQITDQLRSLIGNGVLAVGSPLPSERTLAESLGVARAEVTSTSRKPASCSGMETKAGGCARRLREEKLGAGPQGK